jgi:hypothetical protein
VVVECGHGVDGARFAAAASRLAGGAGAGTMSAMDVERLLLVGDTHGDTAWVRAAVRTATRLDATPVVLGDFGYWTHRGDGREFVADVDAALSEARSVLVFVDGNHEYHSTHPAKPPHKRFGLRELAADDDGFVRITDRLWYAPRGHRWEWSGRRLGALGGAVSTDRGSRKLYRDWWPAERVGFADVDRLGSQRLDVLFTHDSPAGHVVPGFRADDRHVDADSERNRELLAAAVAATRPQLVCHGHWHVRYRCERVHDDGTPFVVEGLGANVDSDGEPNPEFTSAVAVLDLAALTVTDVDDDLTS